ncbi:MAG: tyrosine-type recombinase/integrase [Microcoleaceae cyanobacterium]
MPKRYKGKVGINSRYGCLRLTLPRAVFGGRQKSLSLGLQDTPENHRVAETIALEIEHDILYGRFDPTLEKYRIEKPQIREQTLTLVELYERYIETKRKSARPGTWKNGYQVMLRHLSRSPYARIRPGVDTDGYAQKFIDWAILTLSRDTARRLVVQINACLNWAIASRLIEIERSPFERLKVPRTKGNGEDTDINPFTVEERDSIIQAFKNYPHYYGFVRFVFFTGCRHSEAAALTWPDIRGDKLTFSSAVVEGENGRELVKGLKTQARRSIPINRQLQKILDDQRSEHNSLWVFPSTKGNMFSCRSFRNRWYAILSDLGLERRKPYQTRHTFITLCLQKGLPVQEVAKLVGNSSEIIYRHYAGLIREITIPEL